MNMDIKYEVTYRCDGCNFSTNSLKVIAAHESECAGILKKRIECVLERYKIMTRLDNIKDIDPFGLLDMVVKDIDLTLESNK